MMNLERKLIKLLDLYIKDKKIEASTYEIKLKQKRMYEDLISLLEGNYDRLLEKQGHILSLLNQLSENDDFYQQFKNVISKVEDVKSYISNIIAEYHNHLITLQNYESQMIENTKILDSVHKVKNSLKYNKILKVLEEDISNVTKALEELSRNNEINPKDIVLYLNMLEYHNEMILSKKDIPEEQEFVEFKYNEIPNIINAGFQEHDVIEVSLHNKKNLDCFALEIIEQLKNIDSKNSNKTLEENILDIITMYKNKKLPENEFNYIIIKVLDEYLEELISIYQLLLDKDIYSNKETKEEVISDYYTILNQYIIVNKYYNKSIEYTPEEIQDNEIESQTEKRIIYSRTETNINKTRLINDMDSVPYEYYYTIYDLITRFKKGELAKNECKTLSNHKQLCKHIELRHDQVRIILKHVKEDIYIVLGVFTKKTDNDVHMYSRIINRTIPKTDTEDKLNMQLELAVQSEIELETLVKDKGRKGTR